MTMRFLVAVDLSKASMVALESLESFAAWGGADVTLLHVVDLDLYTAGGSIPGIMEFAEERLTAEAERLSGCGLNLPSVRVEQGDPTQTILRVAAEDGADLIVMTNLGKGARSGRLFGSTAERVAFAGPVPVLVERVGMLAEDTDDCCRLVEGSPFERVLVAVDLEHSPDALLARVLTLPGLAAARIVHVAADGAGAAAAQDALSTLAGPASAPVSLEGAVLLGKPAEEILDDAARWGATAIALHPCGHGALHRAVWGSVARVVARDARLPVLFVAAEE